MSGKFKTPFSVAAIGCFVFLFVLASAAADKNTTWTKYDNTKPDASDATSTNGRIPVGESGQGDMTHVGFQSVIKDGSTYKMWYSGCKAAEGWFIYYASSTDGLTWTKYNNNKPDTSDTTNWGYGRIPLGTEDMGDEKQVMCVSVIKGDSIYKMWYGGRDIGDTNRIYYATSPDGLTWTKYSNSIPTASNSTGTYGRIPLGTSGGDSAGICGPCVIKDGSTYKMWYSGSDGTNYRIYHATSSNGLTWIKYDNSVPDPSDTTSTNGRIPLGATAGRGDTNHVAYPAVIKVGSTYKMWYSGSDGSIWRIYYATSPDGLTWTKYTNAIPTVSNTTGTDGRIPIGTSGGDNVKVIAPCVIKEGVVQEGYTYKMWYTGYADRWRIYLATCEQPPPACTIFYSY